MDTRKRQRMVVTIELLGLFARVAELGSIAGAARELNVSPSVATRRLASLERALSTRLFQRTTRSLKLTEGGAIALEWARQSLESYGKVTDDLAAIEGRPSGLVRLVANEFAAVYYLPPFLSRFARDYPDIRLSITTTDNVVNLVEQGCDVALHSGQIPDSSYVGVRVREFQRVLCASPAYLERRGVPRRLEDLARHDCLVHEPTEPVNWMFRRGKRLVSHPIRQYVVANNHVVLIELARHGMGIIRISRNAVGAWLRAGELVQVLPEYQCVYPSGELPGLWILYPNRRLLTRTRVFVDALAKHLETT